MGREHQLMQTFVSENSLRSVSAPCASNAASAIWARRDLLRKDFRYLIERYSQREHDLSRSGPMTVRTVLDPNNGSQRNP